MVRKKREWENGGKGKVANNVRKETNQFPLHVIYVHNFPLPPPRGFSLIPLALPPSLPSYISAPPLGLVTIHFGCGGPCLLPYKGYF